MSAVAISRAAVAVTPSVVRAFLEGLERDLGPALSGFPLYEPLFQLMCHPVSAREGGTPAP